MGQHVVSPICTPSRYNCLTGKYASRATNSFFVETTKKNENQTVVSFNTHITSSDANLQKYLQAFGYTTGMTGKNHVVEVLGLQKFKSYEESARDPENIKTLKFNQSIVKKAMENSGFDFVGNVYHNNPDFLGLHEVAVQNMDWITQGGIDFLNKKKQGKPFFLYFATTVPHEPFDEYRSWNANPLITAEGYLEEPLNVQAPRNSIASRLKEQGFPVNKDTANMLWLDDSLGALVHHLENKGELDSTIVFFFSDHGQNAKGTLYQGGVHNPSIVWKKGGFKVGSKSQALISNVDFAPTILDMVGAKWKDKDFDGISFLPVLNGREKFLDRVLYHELGYARAVRIGDWKYITVHYPKKFSQMSLQDRTLKLNKWNNDRALRHIPIVTKDPKKRFSHLTALPGGGHAEHESTGSFPYYYDPEQIYNLKTDPEEQNNLIQNQEMKPTIEKLKTELLTIMQKLPGTFPINEPSTY